VQVSHLKDFKSFGRTRRATKQLITIRMTIRMTSRPPGRIGHPCRRGWELWVERSILEVVGGSAAGRGEESSRRGGSGA
jgi:hypothetical protein